MQQAVKLPRSLREIADVLGTQKTLFLVGQLPKCYAGIITNDGRTKKGYRPMLYVPTLARLKPDHFLVGVLGWNDAAKLSREFGGEILQPASCADLAKQWRDSNIRRLHVSCGVEIKCLSEWFSVSERTIKNVLSEIPQQAIAAPAANDDRG
jgi:hypothetical protein